MFSYGCVASASASLLQKPAEKDNRWFVAADLETALQVAKAKPDVRVACLAATGRLDEISLQGLDKELIFCTNKSTSRTVISRVAKAFVRKQFKVSLIQKTWYLKKVQNPSKKFSFINAMENLLSIIFIDNRFSLHYY